MRAHAALGAVWAAACVAPDPPSPAPAPLPDPPPAAVAAVLYLVGDAGDHPREEAPLLHRLRDDVERWSAALATDSAVTVLYLGDNVYPEGVRPREHAGFPDDSARLHAQVWAVEGPEARRRGTRALFLAGNHDWGNERAPEGVARLRNEEVQLAAHRRRGVATGLIPSAGDPGPHVVDLGAHARVVALDTHWWLQSADSARRAAAVREASEALRSAGGRHVVLAAHHPNVSAGRHGEALWTGLDPLWLLRRAGAIVQDMGSAPYRTLLADLDAVFAAGGAPLVYAAGHDHSLQVLAGSGPARPTWTLVSGAGSKLDGVGRTDELVWASDDPGYMRLVIRADGHVDLFVEAAPEGHLSCRGDPDMRAACIERGVAAFRRVFAMRLR